MILKGFGLVAFFASVKTSSVCIHLSSLVCIKSVVHCVRSRLFCGHEVCSLPEVSITSFLPLQFFVSVRLSVQFSDPYKNVDKTKINFLNELILDLICNGTYIVWIPPFENNVTVLLLSLLLLASPSSSSSHIGLYVGYLQFIIIIMFRKD